MLFTLFGRPASPAAIVSDGSDYTMGVQFTLSAPAALTGIWFYSAPGAVSLPDGTCIYQVTGPGTGAQVAGTVNLTAAWSGAAGAGWVKVTYDGTVTLSAATPYKACIHHGFSTNFYSATLNYWSSGPGAGGITSGILSAPANGGGDGGQDTFTNPSAGFLYPATSSSAANYWVDVEVLANSGSGLVLASGTVP